MARIGTRRKKHPFETGESIHREIKPFGKNSAHITLPKKYIGYTVEVTMEGLVRHWNEGYLKKFRERGDKKESI